MLNTCLCAVFTVHEKEYCQFSKKEQKKSSSRGIDKAFDFQSKKQNTKANIKLEFHVAIVVKNVKPSKFMFKIYTQSKT